MILTISSHLASAACLSVSPTAVDTPAATDPGTGLLFRSSCGTTNATVEQCPYLCSQAGGGAFQQCSDEDLSGQEPTGQFPPIECTQCLPPCGSASSNGMTTTTSPTCTSVVPAKSDTPSIIEPAVDLLVRSTCGITLATIDECPFLCFALGVVGAGNCSSQDFTGLVSQPLKAQMPVHLFRNRRLTTASTGH